jgi:hypothetical protein
MRLPRYRIFLLPSIGEWLPEKHLARHAGMPSAVALESVSALHRIRFRTQAAFLKRARRLARHIYHSIV